MNATRELLNFQEALISLVAYFDEVRIPWREGEAYDEWDDVATALFTALVAEPVKWDLNPVGSYQFRLPAYDMLSPLVAESHYIAVLNSGLTGSVRFHSFGTLKTPFDAVNVIVSRPGSDDSLPSLEKCPVLGCTFEVVAVAP
jgi:hypothetical protein